ncbi:uncharacterized protein LOC143457454 [Clavelina lepadiformis]|uniref:uncharacterized protein LOC143457454 n=1 Tax=Clavelina lepadiformis TaxID=159417 RepID=UPI0040434872
MVAYIVEELRFQIDASSFVSFIVCFQPLSQSPASMQPPPAKPSYVTFRSRLEGHVTTEPYPRNSMLRHKPTFGKTSTSEFRERREEKKKRNTRSHLNEQRDDLCQEKESTVLG